MALETTTLDRRWLAKMTIFFAVLVFFGFYGLYDATIAYPNRGIQHASYCEYQYLETAREQGLLDRRVTVADPAGELRRLREADRRMPAVEAARMEWLRSLAMVGRNKPEFTTIEDPVSRHSELKQQWTTAQGAGKNAPKALGAYDIPVQWLFVVIGFGGGAWMAGLFLAVKRVRYRWDGEGQVLHLPGPGGAAQLTPHDIAEFDKRKWDKYLVFLKIKPSHATLGGREIKLDLYRHAKLESWILEMEKTAFPENVEPAPEPVQGEQAPSEEVTASAS
jgi:hypothetical protein